MRPSRCMKISIIEKVAHEWGGKARAAILAELERAGVPRDSSAQRAIDRMDEAVRGLRVEIERHRGYYRHRSWQGGAKRAWPPDDVRGLKIPPGYSAESYAKLRTGARRGGKKRGEQLSRQAGMPPVEAAPDPFDGL